MKYTQQILLVTGVFALTFVAGCKKEVKEQEVIETTSTSERHKQLSGTILAAVNRHDYETAQRTIQMFFEQYPHDQDISSFKLMLADLFFEEGKYEAAFDGYNAFKEYYPADKRVEYASYKAAHAKFNVANHVNCDSAPIEAALALCKDYTNHSEYQQYRQQMADLERTCQRNLLDKEFYIAKSYLDQNRLASARHRLNTIAEQFDLGAGGKDQLFFYQLQLAKRENDSEAVARLLDDLHEDYPHSQFTIMADRFVGRRMSA